jgi:methyl-accepting chemotaxis protein
VFIVFAFGSHYHSLRTHLIRDILVQMNVVANSIGPAVMFGEVSSAAKTLEPLTDNQNIRSIVILNQQQQPLQSLHPEHPRSPAVWQWLYPFFGDMELTTPIVVNEKTVGSLHATITQEQIVDVLIGFAWSNAIAVLASALVGCLIMWRLNRNIVDPIHALQSFVSNITRNHHYDQRVRITSADEIGMLGHDINNMLESIRQRDSQLQTELEHRKVIEEKLQFLAHYDKNTQLLNRHAFEEAITRKITASPDDRKHVYLLLLEWRIACAVTCHRKMLFSAWVVMSLRFCWMPLGVLR